MSYQKRREQILEEFEDIIRPSWKTKILPISIVIIGLGYLLYVIAYFDMTNIGKRWDTQRAALFSLDSYAYKIHVQSYWKDPTKLKVTLEGSRYERYDPVPEWVIKTDFASKTISY